VSAHRSGEVRRVAVIGTGVIGAGWAARFLAHGLEVWAFDPAPGAEARLREALDRAWPALAALGLPPEVRRGRLRFAGSLAEACAGAELIQEAAPEREALKQALLAEIDAHAAPEALVASSSSGLLPSRLQARCAHPGRVLVGHPFNPVYLLPLVEVVGGEATARPALERAIAFYRACGMHPLEVRREVEGYLSDRLQEALWRENLHLVNDGVASPEELDAAIVYGPGLRWAFMGVNLTFHLAGGEAGMRHMLEQFGPALELPWTRLEAPELTPELAERLVAGGERLAAGRSIAELERLRDQCLVAILKALARYRAGAGALVAEQVGEGRGGASSGADNRAR